MRRSTRSCSPMRSSASASCCRASCRSGGTSTTSTSSASPTDARRATACMNHLKSAGIGCEVYYPLTLPQQECFTDVPSASEPFPHSDTAAATTLAIPIFPELTKDQMAEVVREIGKGLG